MKNNIDRHNAIAEKLGVLEIKESQTRKPKQNCVAEKTGVTSVTGVTASNGGGCGGNTYIFGGVTGVTVIDLNTAIDPLTTPQETLEIQSPPLEQRPCYRCHTDFWQDDDGKTKPSGVWLHGLSKGDDPKAIDTWICGEMQIVAIARDRAGRSFGQVLRFKNKLHQWQVWNMPTRLLAGRGDELLKELFDMAGVQLPQTRTDRGLYQLSDTR